ncbi:endonuclease III [Candidatus Woesearchaeota archaeon CG1_02_57_44]|nr:MAG: endonuclease III [Candidatus Woesearchaeota archaeon CG1_02_57_44]
MTRCADGGCADGKRDLSARVRAVLRILQKSYPDAGTALRFNTPFQLLCATILSAQCTDARVNIVTPVLFSRYPDARTLAVARQADVERIIHSTGFFRAKARHLIGCSKALVAYHAGQVPKDMASLVALPGVGRKTANVVLWNAFGMAWGIAVDTHVQRITRLLGWTRRASAERIEQDLMRLVPNEHWGDMTHWLIAHGRAVCIAGRPRCDACQVEKHCPGSRKGIITIKTGKNF